MFARMISILLLIQSLGLTAAVHQAASLGKFDYKGASVLPYVEWKSKKGKHYFLLGREAGGKDQGTWDSFGGSAEFKEKHPLITAAREFAEETAFAIMSPSQAEKYINVDGKHTTDVIAHKKSVIYLTKFDESDMKDLSNKFYPARQNSKLRRTHEKTAIAWVREDRFKNAIKNAPRDKNGRLIKPILVEGDVIQSDGKLKREKLSLRPFMVSMLQPYYQGKSYTQGKSHKIRFY